MEIRIRESGQVVMEQEFRAMHPNTSFASLDETTLDAFGADVVFEGPQAIGGEFWQYSMRNGVEQINDKWYTKYVLGPIFTDNDDATAEEQQAIYVAQKTAEKNAALQESIVSATQKRLDDFAKTRNYDGVLSLCTYATSTNVNFKMEGQYGVEARDATWSKLYQIMAEVEAGTRPMPNGYADIESELPTLTWPNESRQS